MRHNALIRLFLLVLVIGLAGLAPFAASFSQPADSGLPEEIVGELEVLYGDDFANQRAELMHFVKDRRTGKRLRLRFEGTPPGHLRSGAVVKARGRARDDEFVLAADGDGTQSVTVVQAAAAMVSGEQRTLVMMSNFTDASVSCSVNSVRDLMFTDAASRSIDDLYQETSFGEVWFTGQVIGPYGIAYSSGACEFSAWADAIDAKARADGFDPDAYTRKVYILPQNGCPAAGIGDLGGSPSRAWVFHCDIADVFGHELGHNFGMHHAATPAGEYGDNTDIMGLSQNKLRQVNAPHKEQMGWLPTLQAQAITQSGVYYAAPLEVNPLNAFAPQALKILKANTDEYYYLSYRRGLGFDANLSSFRYLNRLSVHRYADNGSAEKTYLLAALADGESFVDPVNGITVTTMSHNDDYLTVEVQFNANCAAAAPVVGVAPASQSAQPGGQLDYTVSLTNKDSGACSQSVFDLRDAVPSGWAASVFPSTLTLAPGQSGSATLSVVSAISANAASYAVSASASDSAEAGHSTSATATYVVTSPCIAATPQVALSPASQRANAGTTVQYSVAVTNADGAGCSQSRFDLTGSVPSAWTASVSPGSLTLAPGETRQAAYSVTSPSSAGQGLYSVSLHATDGADPSRTVSEGALYEVQVSSADTTPPTAPSGLAASAKRKQVNLSWGASTDNVGVSGYRVIRNGSLLVETPETSYVDRGVTKGASYSYQVFAFDAAGNPSSPSNSATVSFGGGAKGNGGRGKPK